MSAPQQQKKAVHFGAGNIGRGFVACFLHASGYEVVFADVADSLIDKINAQKSYKVIEVGTEGTQQKTITNYRAINSKNNEEDLIDELSTADVITCSVGPRVLKFIAPVIAKALAKRPADMAPAAVIACENAINATSELEGYIKDNASEELKENWAAAARYANSAIDRIVPAQDADAGLDVKLEQFFEWVVESTPFDGQHPTIEGINWVPNLEPYIERKLYTVNTGHATAAYFGYNRNKRTVYDALTDKAILAEVRAALAETSNLICKKHGVPRDEQAAYVKKIINRISNPHLEDVVERVGRAPLRKISRKERFVGPAAQLAEMGEGCDALLRGVEMALRFQNVEDDEESQELAKLMTSKPADELTRELCGLSPSDKLYPQMLSIVETVKADSA